MRSILAQQRNSGPDPYGAPSPSQPPSPHADVKISIGAEGHLCLHDGSRRDNPLGKTTRAPFGVGFVGIILGDVILDDERRAIEPEVRVAQRRPARSP